MTHPAFKLMIVGRRRAGTTLAQHHHHILNVHGALVANYIAADPAHAPKRYAQNRVLDGTFRKGGAAGDPFALNRDFVTQIWFDDPAQAMNSVQRPFYLEQLRPDEDRFVDQASVVKLAVREQQVAPPRNGGGNIKLFSFFSKVAAMDSAQFVKIWRECGKALADSVSGSQLYGHVQNEVLNRPGEAAPVDAIDEFWVADLDAAALLAEALHSAMVAPLLAAGAIADESHFILLAEEAVLFKGITP
jgi:vanillate O-demethylase ferredoxin subunit